MEKPKSKMEELMEREQARKRQNVAADSARQAQASSRQQQQPERSENAWLRKGLVVKVSYGTTKHNFCIEQERFEILLTQALDRHS